MDTTGTVAEIRELLAQGESSRDVIEMGYAPGSVYKARRLYSGCGSPSSVFFEGQQPCHSYPGLYSASAMGATAAPVLAPERSAAV